MAELTVTQGVDAAPDTVWRALTESDRIAAWFWPARFGTVAATDPRPGGAYSIRATTVDLGASGTYRTVAAPSTLAFTWRWDGDDTASTVTIAIGDDLVTLTDTGLPDESAVDRHTQGWSGCLSRLATYLSGPALA